MPSMSAEGRTFPELDADNRIRLIEGDRDEYVRNNTPADQSTGSLINSREIGKRRETYTRDDHAGMFRSTPIAGVRQIKSIKTITYPYASPGMRRFARIVHGPRDPGCVRMIHFLLKLQTNEPAAKIVPANSDAEKIDLRCRIFNRIALNRTWPEPDEASAQSGRTGYHVSHRVCPVCRNSV